MHNPNCSHFSNSSDVFNGCKWENGVKSDIYNDYDAEIVEEHINTTCFMLYDEINDKCNPLRDSFNGNMNIIDTDNVILDSGASCHMFNTYELMIDYRVIKSNTFKITGFNGMSESAISIGNLGILRNVLYVPNIQKSIISTTALCKDGYTISSQWMLIHQ